MDHHAGDWLRWVVVRGLVLACYLFSTGAYAEPAPLRVAAAADLRLVLPLLVAEFQRHHALKVDVVYGSSGKLSQQIQMGAPFDLFVAADMLYTQRLFNQGVTSTAGRHFANGQLVLWSLKYDVRTLPLAALEEPRFAHIALASPQHAPYGQRAQQVLERAQLWSTLQSKLVFGDNVGQATQFVQSGAADVAFIARALVPHTQQNQPLGFSRPLATTEYSPLRQSLVLTRQGEHKLQAQQFAQFMVDSPVAAGLLQQYGFNTEALQ